MAHHTEYEVVNKNKCPLWGQTFVPQVQPLEEECKENVEIGVWKNPSMHVRLTGYE